MVEPRRELFFAFFVVQIFFVSSTREAAAQERFEAGAQVTFANSSEFDRLDVGFGGRLAWYPVELLGAEAELNLYPRNFPVRVPFSRDRVEGLFGVTAGPRFAHARPFVRLRPGFVTFREAPQPIACILIFPPPLSCQLAAGRTLFVLDVGGGVELFTGGKSIVRVDAGDRMLKYPGPSFRTGGRATQDAFVSHDLRVAVGAGVRF